MFGVCAAAHAAEPAWVRSVGKDTLVCVSPAAPAPVQQAAARVLAALKTVQPDAALLDPDKLATDYDALGTHHVICIGEWADNQVLRMTWGYWATSKARRDWQAKGDARAVELMNLWEKDIPDQAWRNGHDFFAFGYGDFDGPDIGYVQTVRNPFPILLRTVPGQKTYDTSIIRVYDRPPYNQMYFMVHLTGTGPAGVVKAVDAFLNQGMLNGVMPGQGQPLLTEWNLEGLGPRQLANDLPAWAPTANLPEGARYLGWLMPGSHLYAGFTEASGQRPVRCWRLKYALPDGFVFYPSYPTSRASGNELFIAELPDAEAATKAADSLRKTMGPDPQLPTWEFGGHSYALYATSYQQRKSFAAAKAFCEKQGGHLITLGSKEEQDALRDVMARNRVQTIFIGLTGDWRSNEWQWVTGEPLTFRGWLIKDGKELFGYHLDKIPQRKPAGPYPVLFTNQQDPWGVGWYLADSEWIATDAGYFACEWDKPGAAPKAVPRQRVATRDNYVIMQSFDDLSGDALLQKAVGK
jgi:hypothetical protein